MENKKKNQFVKKLTDIAIVINEQLFEKRYKVQIFFSGRDEDFVTLEFKDDRILIEITILINNQYVIAGHEQVAYQVFTFDERNKSQLFTEERWILIDESDGNQLKKLLHQLIVPRDSVDGE